MTDFTKFVNRYEITIHLESQGNLHVGSGQRRVSTTLRQSLLEFSEYFGPSLVVC